jgi:hypothetical protein
VICGLGIEKRLEKKLFVMGGDVDVVCVMVCGVVWWCVAWCGGVWRGVVWWCVAWRGVV